MNKIATRSNSFGVEAPAKLFFPECASATPGSALQRLRRRGRPSQEMNFGCHAFAAQDGTESICHHLLGPRKHVAPQPRGTVHRQFHAFGRLNAIVSETSPSPKAWHPTSDRPTRICRSAFTLVEMLVVLALVLLLSAIAIAVLPSAVERQKTSRGADQLQGWLLVAKQWAKRDGVPTGIRLQPGMTLPNTATPNSAWITNLEYIQQPDPFDPAGSQIQPGTVATQVTAFSSSVDFFGGTGPGNSALWPVQIGDSLEIFGGGFPHLITGVLPSMSNPLVSDTLTLASTPSPFTPTGQYRIIRAPRVLPGELTLQMPKDVAIDTKTNTTYINPLPSSVNAAGAFDILFTPSGSVLSLGVTVDKINLWVRDVTQDLAAPADQTLITVYVRSGFIAAHPVDVTPDPLANPLFKLDPYGSKYFLNPYSFTQDGRSSGL